MDWSGQQVLINGNALTFCSKFMGLCQKGLCSNKEATNVVSKLNYSPLLKPLQNGYSIVIIVQTSCIPNVDSHLNSGYQDLSILLLLFFILYELIPLFICWAQIPFLKGILAQDNLKVVSRSI